MLDERVKVSGHGRRATIIALFGGYNVSEKPPTPDTAAPEDSPILRRVRALQFKQLRYFVSVAESGSIARAAAALHLAQPGLSKRLSDLEYTLSAKLLRRLPQGVQLTEQGQTLYKLAKRILGDVDDIALKLHSIGEQPAGKVILGCAIGASRFLGYPLYRAVRSRLPYVQLVFVSGISGALYRMLLSGDLDAALISPNRPLQGITSRALIREKMFLVGTPALLEPLGPGPIKGRQLASLPIIAPSSTLSIRDVVEEVLAADRLELNVVAEVNDWDVIRRLLTDGEGCAFGPWTLVHEEVMKGSLALRPIGNPPLERDIELCTGTEKPPSAAVAAVLKVARETIASLIADGSWPHAQLLSEDGNPLFPSKKKL
jgi:LysR family nitrogen assimilation transcriptional regulator